MYILHSGRQCYTACQLWHVSSALLCVWMWPNSFLTIHLLHRANFTFAYFVDPSRPQNSHFSISCFLFLIRLPSVHRGVVVSAAVFGGLPGRYPLPQREAVHSTCRHAVPRGGHTVHRGGCRCARGAGGHLLRPHH